MFKKPEGYGPVVSTISADLTQESSQLYKPRD